MSVEAFARQSDKECSGARPARIREDCVDRSFGKRFGRLEEQSFDRAERLFDPQGVDAETLG